MAVRRAEAEWLTENCAFSLEELVELSGLQEAELRVLVDYGAIAPVDPGASQWVFTATCLTTVRVATRLRASFELEPHGVALVAEQQRRVPREHDEQLVVVRVAVPDRRAPPRRHGHVLQPAQL